MRSAATSTDVKPDVSLIEGLDAESIDFLDMVFRLERAFKIKIPRGKIVENARGALSEAEFEQKGVVTDVGLAQLKAYLSEVPADRFRTPMKVKDIPRLFTPETFCKLVIARTAAKPRRPADAPAGFRAAPGSAWLITSLRSRSSTGSPSSSRRSRARGRFAVPADVAGFSVVPRRRGGGPARSVGRDGAHRLSRRVRSRRWRNETRFLRDVAPGRRAGARQSRSTAAMMRPLRTAGAARRRRRARDRAQPLPGADAAGRRIRFAGGTRHPVRSAVRRGCAPGRFHGVAAPRVVPQPIERQPRDGCAVRAGARAVLQRPLPAAAGVSRNVAAERADRASR